MLLLAADENFNNNIVRGMLRRQPSLDAEHHPGEPWPWQHLCPHQSPVADWLGAFILEARKKKPGFLEKPGF